MVLGRGGPLERLHECLGVARQRRRGPALGELQADPQLEVADQAAQVAGAPVLGGGGFEDRLDAFDAAAAHPDLGEVVEGEGEPRRSVAGAEQAQGMARGALGTGQVVGRDPGHGEVVPEPAGLGRQAAPATVGEGRGNVLRSPGPVADAEGALGAHVVPAAREFGIVEGRAGRVEVAVHALPVADVPGRLGGQEQGPPAVRAPGPRDRARHPIASGRVPAAGRQHPDRDLGELHALLGVELVGRETAQRGAGGVVFAQGPLTAQAQEARLEAAA